MLIYSDNQIEEEDEADDELVLIGLHVKEAEDDSNRTILTSNWTNFPNPRGTLSGGAKAAVLCPDSGLSALYSDTRTEVHHEPGKIAKCLLSGNYLPPAVFGREADHDLRGRVFDEVGLEDTGISDDGDIYRNQLREIAGLEMVDEDEEEFESDIERMTSENKYGELQTMAKEAGIDDARQSKDDLAEYILSQDE